MYRSIKTMDFFNSDFMLQTPHHEDQNQPILTSCTSHEFHGAAHSLLGKRIQPMSEINVGLVDSYKEDRHCMNNHGHDDDLSDDETQLAEKKRRLNVEQVRALERNFEIGNKLEPERKMQLARALGLRPRQIAIWFQNRRARSKTKQVERDYELLKGQFDSVVSENDALREQNQKLHAEIVALKTKRLELLPTESINLNKGTEGGCCSNRISETENSSEIIKVEISTAQTAVDDRSSLISTHAAANIANKSTFFLNSSLIKTSANGGMSQLFQMNNSLVSSRPENISFSKNITDRNVKEESSLCNMFCNGMEDHAGFWPWLD